MRPDLTDGFVRRVFSGEDMSNSVVQILGAKKIAGNSDNRYRLLITDGTTGCYAMLGTQLNSMLFNRELDKFSIVRVDRCVTNQLPDKKVLILLGLTVLSSGAEVGERIGTLTNYDASVKPDPVSSTTDTTINKEPSTNPNTSREGQNGYYDNSANASTNVPNDMSINIHPINSLTPYQNRWTIKARVTSKTPIRTWSKPNSEGKLFSVNFLDETGEIRATGFNDAVDKFYELLEVNKVYYVTKATLKNANKQYTSVKNDYEMSFNHDTTIAICEEKSSIPLLQFNFVPISEIENVDKDAMIDVIAICKSASDTRTLMSRNTNKEFVKRDIILVDMSNKEVVLTLWNAEAEKFDGSLNPVIAVKGVKVSDFNGRSLSTVNSSMMQMNPDIKEAHVLKGWYEREGRNIESDSISGGNSGNSGGQWKTFAQVNGERLGMGEKPDYFVNKCTVVMVRKENCMYMACPSEECNKKVVDMNNGLYRCEKCNREYDKFQWRLLLSISVADFTENVWVTCFQEAGEILLGSSAEALGRLKESNEEKFNEIVADMNFKSYTFKLRTKMETFNEESRLKTSVVTVSEIDPVAYSKKLLADIKQMQSVL